MFHKTVRARKAGLNALAFFGAGLLGVAALPAVAGDDAPVTIGGKVVALTVTGKGDVEVKATGYSVGVTFYNDATGQDAATTQNLQAEASLQKALLQAGVTANRVSFPVQRRLGFPSGSGDIGGVTTTSSGPPRANETARAARVMFIQGGDFASLPKLITALQSVGAEGVINVSYYFGEDKTLSKQTLKKAVADGVAQIKILETASLPRKLLLLSLEPSEFIGASMPTMGFPLSVPKSPGAPSASQFTSVLAPTNGAHQDVVLRYALVDAPLPAKPIAKPVAASASKPAAPRPAPVKKG